MIDIKHKDGTVIRTIDAPTLHGADLRGADLREADLRRAHLIGAKISAEQMPDIIKALGIEVMP